MRPKIYKLGGNAHDRRVYLRRWLSRLPCTICDGHGIAGFDDGTMRDCPLCEGTGIVHFGHQVTHAEREDLFIEQRKKAGLL